MRSSVRVKAFLAILVSLILAIFSQPALAADKVEFGISHGHDIYFLPGFVAKDRGFWKANGIDVELTYFKGGGDIITAAGAGKLKIGTAPASSIAMAVMRGAPLKMVSARAITGKGMCLIARKGINSWNDLKNKKIGITNFGGSLDFMLRKSLQRVGLDPEKDVSILPLGSQSANESAFLTGQTDAYGWTLDVAKKFERDYGTSTFFFDVAMPSGIFAHNDFIRGNPGLIARTLKAWYQASRYMKENPEYTIKTMAKEWEVSEEDAGAFYKAAIDDVSLDGTFTKEGLENSVESLKLMPKVKPEELPSIEDFFTSQFLPVR